MKNKIIYISFIVKSNDACEEFFVFIPKTILNQHLEKPIKPITFAINKIKKHKNGEDSKKPEKI